MCTACRRRSHGPPHQRTDLPPGAPQAILSTSRGMLEVAITLVRPTQHPSWHFVTTRVQNLHKRATRGHERGGNGGSCGLITRQNAPLAPVSIARHHDTSAQPPEAPLRSTRSPHGCGGLPLGQQPEHGQLDLWAGRAGNKTNLDWWRVTDSTHRPHRAPFASQLAQARLVLIRERQTGGGPARRRTQPCTISGSEDKPTLHSLEASKDAVNITPTDTTSGHRHFPRRFFFW